MLAALAFLTMCMAAAAASSWAVVVGLGRMWADTRDGRGLVGCAATLVGAIAVPLLLARVAFEAWKPGEGIPLYAGVATGLLLLAAILTGQVPWLYRRATLALRGSGDAHDGSAAEDPATALAAATSGGAAPSAGQIAAASLAPASAVYAMAAVAVALLDTAPPPDWADAYDVIGPMKPVLLAPGTVSIAVAALVTWAFRSSVWRRGPTILATVAVAAAGVAAAWLVVVRWLEILAALSGKELGTR